MSDDGAPTRSRWRLVLGSMLVLLLTVGILVLTGVYAANSVGLRWGRIILLGPKFVGIVRLDGASLEVTPTLVSYDPGPANDRVEEPWPVLLREEGTFDVLGELRPRSCHIDHWRRWVLIEDHSPVATGN